MIIHARKVVVINKIAPNLSFWNTDFLNWNIFIKKWRKVRFYFRLGSWTQI